MSAPLSRPACEARGHSITALARNASSEQRLRTAGVQVVPGDLARSETYRDATASADVIVHTAFEYSADGAENIELDTARDARRCCVDDRLIYTSNGYRPRLEAERMVLAEETRQRGGSPWHGVRRFRRRNHFESVRCRASRPAASLSASCRRQSLVSDSCSTTWPSSMHAWSRRPRLACSTPSMATRSPCDARSNASVPSAAWRRRCKTRL